MTGPATYAARPDAAAAARDRLDRAAASAAAVDAAQRDLLAGLIGLWPTSAWRAAGATSAKRWLLAYTHCTEPEAHRLERLAGLCHRHPPLADAVLSGGLSLARVDRLAAVANPEREPWLIDSLPDLLDLNARGGSDEDWSTIVRHWAELVDQERTVRQVPRHSLTLTQRLFGGGEIHGDLSPSAFLNVATAIESWTDDPDPSDAPYRRTLGERRADALDDLCRASLDPSNQPEGDDEVEWEDIVADDTFDGWAPTDTLDEALDPTLHDDDEDDGLDLSDPLDHLRAIRRRLRHAETCRRRRARRRTRARANDTAETWTPDNAGPSPPETATASSPPAPDHPDTATSTTSNTKPTADPPRPRTGRCCAGSTTASCMSTAGPCPSETDDGSPPTATAPPGPADPAPPTNPPPRPPADPTTPRPGHRRAPRRRRDRLRQDLPVTTLVFLLRGINVGGSGKLAMSDLRSVAERLGMADVQTYIQSGNLVARWDRDPTRAAEELRGALDRDLGFAPGVLVRTGEQLGQVVERGPFLPVDEPKHVHVVFLDTDATQAISSIDTAAYEPERVVAIGRELHLHLPGGIGRSPLATALAKAGGPAAVGTTRGWRTVTALAAMSAELG